MSDDPSGPSATAALFKTLKNGGFVACLIGVLMMIGGRFMVGAPRWLMYVGVSVIVLGWGLFSYALFQRAAFLRANAPRGENQRLKS